MFSDDNIYAQDSFITLSLRMKILSWKERDWKTAELNKPMESKLPFYLVSHCLRPSLRCFLTKHWQDKSGREARQPCQADTTSREDLVSNLFSFRQVLGVPSWAPGKCP